MKRKIICLMLLCLFILPNTAFATNWVYFGKDIATGLGTEYIDADSVTKDGDKLIYWTLITYDKLTSYYGYTSKYEVMLSPPRKYKILEVHYYLIDKKEDTMFTPSNDTSWDNTTKDDDREIDTALKYAKEGKNNGQLPSLPK